MAILQFMEPAVSQRIFARCVLAVCFCVLSASSADGDEVKRVVILYSNESFLPANISLGNAIVDHMRAELPGRIEFFSEFLDLVRFAGEAHEMRTADGLRAKYSGRHIDLIVTAGPQALSLLAAHRDNLFPSVPIVFTGVREDNTSWHELEGSTGIFMRLDPLPTLELALRLQPGTRRVVVVTGAANFDRDWETVARERFQRYEGRLEIVHLSALPMPQLLAELRSLGPDAVVIYLTIFNDGAGQYFLSADAARLVAAASAVPVYGLYDTYLGCGIVGGCMDTFERVGRETGKLGLRILQGERPGNIVPRVPGESVTTVDWNELRRWGLSEGLLPTGSDVRSRRPSLWEEHRGTAFVVAAVMGLQTALVVGLLIQRRNRRRAEQEVYRQEERFRSVVESTPSAIVMANAAGVIVLVNSQAEKSFAYRREELVGQSIDILLPDRFHAEDPQLGTGLFAVHSTSPMLSGSDLYGRRSDSSEFPIEIGVTPLQTRQEHFVLYVIVDITQRREIEETRQELAHAARLAIVGELTASIAHEINQPLGAILSNADAAEMLLDSIPESLDEVRQILDDIRKDDLRASEVIRRMRALLRKRAMETQAVDLNEVISEVVGLIRAEAMRRSVAIEVEAPADIGHVIGDRVHLQQVLLNLVLNGMEAMAHLPGAKKLTVRSGLNENGSVEIAVIDGGNGIASDQLERLFDPFFTTKNEGMGLGLPIARAIVEAHGGRLRADNNPSGGATFRFTIPTRIENEGEETSAPLIPNRKLTT